MFKLLIDTSAWLHLAENPQQEALLQVLERLTERGEACLIIPRVVINEIAKNKPRIVRDSGRRLSTLFKQVKEAVHRHGKKRTRNKLLDQLNEIDNRIPNFGELVNESIGRIEKLLTSAPVIETTDAVKLRAAQRAIDKRAPFHHDKNSINDCILIEIYADCIQERGHRFAFVTGDRHDFFSMPKGDKRLPHPDIADLFSKKKSLFFGSLHDAIRRINPSLTAEIFDFEAWEQPIRSFAEISDAIGELTDKVWYNRHLVWLEKIEDGIFKVVEKETFPVEDHATRPIERKALEGAMKSAKRLEHQYGRENLGPFDDFDWGMINGKLSALRWVFGEDWDELYT